MKLPSIEKRVVWLLEAIDKHVKTEQEQYMALLQSTVRPFVRRWAKEHEEQDA